MCYKYVYKYTPFNQKHSVWSCIFIHKCLCMYTYSIYYYYINKIFQNNLKIRIIKRQSWKHSSQPPAKCYEKVLPLGGEVMESLIQKEYESCTLHLIFFSNLGSRNNLWEKKRKKERRYTMLLHVCLFFFLLCVGHYIVVLIVKIFVLGTLHSERLNLSLLGQVMSLGVEHR